MWQSVSGHDNLRALVRADFIAGFRQQFDADRLPAAAVARNLVTG